MPRRGRPRKATPSVDRAQATGLEFVHFNGMSGSFYQPEIMAPGVGLFDYDNDGDLDVYLVQGQMLGNGKTFSQAVLPPKEPLPLRGRLYRNDLDIASHTLRFTDVTDRRASTRGYGMGVAAGDYNNDGRVDLYLTNFGPNQLFRNNCDGTFADVSRTSGAVDAGWSVPAAFVDFDRDGWLDLFVGHYLAYSVDRHVNCFTDSKLPDYCPPERYRPEPDRLYRNLQNGTFADVTASSGVARAFGPALGVATADFNGDRWIESRSPTTSGKTSRGSTSAMGPSRTWRSCLVRRSVPRVPSAPTWGWTPATSTTMATRISLSPSSAGRGAASTSTTAPGCSRNRARGRASGS
jgi:hypothetical protein